MDVPIATVDFINMLKIKYEDKAEVDPTVVGTPEYWKKIGVVELLREVSYFIESKGGR